MDRSIDSMSRSLDSVDDLRYFKKKTNTIRHDDNDEDDGRKDDDDGDGDDLGMMDGRERKREEKKN
ncbi:hypothetical protein MJO29_005207 [Puccinia striiformis f. sp. tritici]|nr:hypothetical protein MJO29_005207 [Puccinia striiformis f. sp. tritici]